MSKYINADILREDILKYKRTIGPNYERNNTAIRILGIVDRQPEAIGVGLQPQLQCNIGDTVYDVSYQVQENRDITPFKVIKIEITQTSVHYYVKNDELNITDILIHDDFGNTVFLTRETAENELKMRNN